LGIIGGVNPDDPSAGFPSYESLEDARLALGDTRRLAHRVDLARLVPDPFVSSTRYALAAEGQEYVIFQPDGDDFTVLLPAGPYEVEWFSLADRSWTDADAVSVDGPGPASFESPSSAASVLHLRNRPPDANR
jgi:hypothetical protein